MKHGIGPRAAKPVAIIVATASLLAPQARADEPQGSITVSRMLPPRDAIRHDGAGYATRIATAREDVVVAGTQFAQSDIAAQPAALSDLALESVAARPAGASTDRLPVIAPLARGAAGPGGGAFDNLNTRAAAPLAGAGAARVQAGVAGGLHALPALGNVLSTALRPGAQK